MNEFKNKMWLK